MDRVCIFIDGSNFYHALKTASLPSSVDFGKLALELTGPNRKHVQTYYYNVPLHRPKPNDPDFATKEDRCREQQRFFNALRFVPNLTFQMGRLQKLPGGGQVEKGVDIAIAVDMLTLAYKDRYDVAILISSDADFKRAIEAIKYETGRQVELHQIAGAKAYDLITVCSIHKPIQPEVIRRCLRNNRPA